MTSTNINNQIFENQNAQSNNFHSKLYIKVSGEHNVFVINFNYVG